MGGDKEEKSQPCSRPLSRGSCRSPSRLSSKFSSKPSSRSTSRQSGRISSDDEGDGGISIYIQERICAAVARALKKERSQSARNVPTDKSGRHKEKRNLPKSQSSSGRRRRQDQLRQIRRNDTRRQAEEPRNVLADSNQCISNLQQHNHNTLIKSSYQNPSVHRIVGPYYPTTLCDHNFSMDHILVSKDFAVRNAGEYNPDHGPVYPITVTRL